MFKDPGSVLSSFVPDIEDTSSPVHEIKRKVLFGDFETPHSSSRKPPASIRAREPGKMVERTESGEQRRVRFPNGADFAHEEEGTSCSCDEDEDEEECHDKNRPFLSKGCGLIPKFCLLNPIPGMKVSGQRLRPDSVRRVRGAGAEEEVRSRTLLYFLCNFP
ncbi:uncharacterized protein A4U43_C06F4980 [Asparagus officinalis]|uniref:Uncharacterized protein n=1 Tax=Asparagus officinalis TaxID=4686 RepID=A0A5P1EKH1_ASPOF|nr:uncharacterized protein A4U43_C06F4980 [Asparagus officinalis]